jgi:ABC-type transporter Mla MlaB component
MIIQKDKQQSQGFMSLDRPSDDTLLIRFSGDWEINQNMPSALDVYEQVAAQKQIRSINFDSTDLASWDSTLLTFLIKFIELCAQAGISIERDGLPSGVQRLLALALEAMEKKAGHKEEPVEPFLARIGETTLIIIRSTAEMFAFIGEAAFAFINMFMGCTGTAHYIIDQRPGGGDCRFRRHCSVEAVRRGDIHCQRRGDRHGAGNGGLDDRYHHDGPHRGRLCRTTRYHGGERGDRCPENTGDIAHGISGHAPDYSPGAHDAAVMLVFGHRGDPWWCARRDRHVRSPHHPILQSNPSVA